MDDRIMDTLHEKTKSSTLMSIMMRRFLLCTGTTFLLTIPLFYILTKLFYAEDMIKIIESVEQGNGIPPLDLEEDIIQGMMIQFVLIFIIISISMFITTRFMTRNLWRPFDETLHKTEHFNLVQDNPPHFADTGINEFNRLNRSLAQLMEKDSEMFRIQKEFTENASHELQTPLAIIRGKLDLLMQENMNGKQMHIVSELYQLTMRMSHLNSNLLLLAKIDNVQYTATEEVDIAAMLAETLPMYGTLQNGNFINIADRQSRHRKPLHANAILLDCMLKNLIVNAIRHSAPCSRVEVEITDNSLTVSNTAENGVLDAPTLFRRFGSGEMKKKGNGLGLSIVKAICDFHKWSIRYAFDGTKHHFTVTFGK